MMLFGQGPWKTRQECPVRNGRVLGRRGVATKEQNLIECGVRLAAGNTWTR
jgi:hypothetical protein